MHHSKHPFPTTQEIILHMDITIWSILKSDLLCFLQPKMESSIQSAKTRQGADCGSDYELLIAKLRLKWKRVGITTTIFTYSVQFSSVTQLQPTLCDPMNHSTPAFPVHHQLPESTQTHSIGLVMASNYLILCRPLLLLPPIFPSIRVFSNESTLHIRWPKYWVSTSTSVLPMNTQD